MEYRVNVQCTDNVSGRTGTFLADTQHNAVSPVFDSLADLFPWMRANGWEPQEYTQPGNVFVPWRAGRIAVEADVYA